MNYRIMHISYSDSIVLFQQQIKNKLNWNCIVSWLSCITRTLPILKAQVSAEK